MTGPNRRVTLVALSVACAAVAAFSNPVFAEQAVGLEARGVDPWAALHNAQGLDVRDADGHPVSVKLIADQLKAAESQKISQTASVSRLPKARVLFRLLELIPSLAGFWGLQFPVIPAHEAWALPVRLRLAEGSGPPALATALALALVLLCCRSQTISRRSLQKSAVLRC
ncbi:MAG: hypothetical protein HY077_16010 [Elusimicrobia bacterium]|nr:hypothetical protein [Elusimicrobiota bacterium]